MSVLPSDPRSSIHWKAFDSQDRMLDEALAMIRNSSAESIERRGIFNIVLTGGNTVRPLYERVRWIDTDWSAWQIFWGDERCVAVDSPDRNSKIAEDLWLSHVPIPACQIHSFGEMYRASGIVDEYERILSTVEIFDFVLLSLGTDGHVASLFPGADLGEKAESAPVLLVDAPAGVEPRKRITLSASRLSKTRNLVIFAWGQDKLRAVEAWRNGTDLPVARLSAIERMDILGEDNTGLGS